MKRHLCANCAWGALLWAWAVSVGDPMPVRIFL
jgi:hypothetical protein